MIALSPETVTAYESRMAKAAVPEGERRAYLRWVRFYLDFCQKYGHLPREAQSIDPFLAKLASKGQSEMGTVAGVLKQKQSPQAPTNDSRGQSHEAWARSLFEKPLRGQNPASMR